jgi:hypothetical protein
MMDAKPTDCPDDIWATAERVMRGVLDKAEFHSVVLANSAWDEGRLALAEALRVERHGRTALNPQTSP